MFNKKVSLLHTKETIAAVMAATMVFLAPSTVFASGEIAEPYQVSETGKDSVFGIAGDFGVFAKESINFTAHSDTNFASKLVVIDRNISVGKCKLDPGISYASTWIQKDNNTNRLEDLNVLVLKKFGKGQKNADGSYMTKDVTKEMINDPLQTIAGKKVDIQIEGEKAFIDFDTIFDRMNLISTELAYYMPPQIPYSAGRQYYDYTNIDTYEDFYCLNMTVDQYRNARDLYIKLPPKKRVAINILNPDNKPVCAGSMKVNVWCSDDNVYKPLIGWTRLSSKVVLNVEGQGIDFDTSNVESGGLILAPGANVKIGNHVGSVICNRMDFNNGEVHYVRTSYPGGCTTSCEE